MQFVIEDKSSIALGFKIGRPFILSSVVTWCFQSGLGALQSVAEVGKPLFNQFSVYSKRFGISCSEILLKSV
jgi:hypothetical protein